MLLLMGKLFWIRPELNKACFGLLRVGYGGVAWEVREIKLKVLSGLVLGVWGWVSYCATCPTLKQVTQTA